MGTCTKWMQEVEEVEEPLGRRNLRAHSVAKEG
jgi:hypothetical protein